MRQKNGELTLCTGHFKQNRPVLRYLVAINKVCSGFAVRFCVLPFFLHRKAGAHELRKRVRPDGAAPFLHRLTGARELR